ncbi:hypothetical protein LINPERPRIM_LOCUS25284 [Linum perenne]
MNSDGSLYTNPTRAASMGIIRDHNGIFVLAFTTNLSTCSIMRAKLRGYYGGNKASLGLRYLEVEN